MLASRSSLGAGLGIAVGVGVGIAVSAVLRHHSHPHEEPTAQPAPISPLPASTRGTADLAVAWWPQDIGVDVHGDGAQVLRFQTSVANLGGSPAAIAHGDHLQYTVRRVSADGSLGPVVGRNSVPLDRGDVEPFPTEFGEEVGHTAASFGRQLRHIDELAPATAAIIGSDHAGQAVTIHDARAGEYILRQQIVRRDGRRDALAFDDVRETHLFLDGAGGFLHASSSYAG